MLTKYVIGTKANPPKKPSASKKGNVIAMNIVKLKSRKMCQLYVAS